MFAKMDKSALKAHTLIFVKVCFVELKFVFYMDMHIEILFFKRGYVYERIHSNYETLRGVWALESTSKVLYIDMKLLLCFESCYEHVWFVVSPYWDDLNRLLIIKVVYRIVVHVFLW